MGLDRLLLPALSMDSWVDSEGNPGLTLVGTSAGVLAQNDTKTIKAGLALQVEAPPSPQHRHWII